MTLKQIEYFKEVCRRGNITNAAEALFVSRSVISRAITELEEEFETPLFIRSKTGVRLTEGGKILSELFDTYSKSYDSVKRKLLELKEEQKHRPLRIGVTPVDAYVCYETYCRSFSERYPEIALYVEERSAYQAGELLLSDALDVFFTTVSPDETMFCSLNLYQNNIALGVSRNDPLAKKQSIDIGDILDLPLGFFNLRFPYDNLLQTSYAARGRKPIIRIRTSDTRLLQNMTLRKEVYPLLSVDSMADWKGVKAIPLSFATPSQTRLIWCRGLPVHKNTELFIKYVSSSGFVR